MNLQQKTLTIFVAVLIALLCIVSVFVAAIQISTYSSLEQKYVTQDLTVAVSRVTEESTALSSIVSDWGPWDDTYNFVNGNLPGYVTTNLQSDTYNNLQVNLIVITDKAGHVVYAGAYDFNTKKMIPVPEYFQHSIDLANPLMSMTDSHAAESGVFMLPDYPMVVASRPIVHTDFSGTPQGVVIMGRYLDAIEVQRLAGITQPSLQILRANDPALPFEVQSAFKDRKAGITEIAKPVNRDQVGGYALVRDIFGNDAIIVEITQPRDIYQQGVATTLQFILIILGNGLIFGLAILFMLNRFVLTRICSLSKQVHKIGWTPEGATRVEIGGDDEFADLATEINRMLEILETTRVRMLNSETRFRELTDLLPQIVFEMDTNGTLTYINKFGLEIFGITEDELSHGMNAQQFVVPEDIERMRHNLSLIAAGGKSPGEVYTFIKEDKTLMRAIAFSSPVIHSGVLEGFRGSVLDISDRLKLEEALADNEQYLKTILSMVQVGIVVIDTDTYQIIDANPAAVAMIGTTKQNILNNVCHRFICPSVDGSCPVTDLGQKIENAEQILLTCDGRRLPVIKYVVPVKLHGKNCLIETFIDNSYRKQIELQLKDSEEKYRALTENTPDILFSATLDGVVTYVSPQVNEYGYLAEEIMGQPLFDLVHPEDRGRVVKTFLSELHEGARFIATFRLLDKWGHTHWFEEKSYMRLDQFGKPQGITGMLRDITERRIAEEAIGLANKKLNLMNNITRHDILNTITGLFGCVDMAIATPVPEERVKLLREIKDLARVIQRQINFTKEYQEVGVHLPAWQDVRDVIEHVMQNFQKSGINFVIDVENMEIYADPLLEKVFYNLIDNAINYGEHVTTIDFYFEISDKGLTLICEDNGVGIITELKSYIFDRGVGRHTGLGLFLSREILSITGITIEETGIPGEGARFELRIPRAGFRFNRSVRKQD